MFTQPLLVNHCLRSNERFLAKCDAHAAFYNIHDLRFSKIQESMTGKSFEAVHAVFLCFDKPYGSSWVSSHHWNYLVIEDVPGDWSDGVSLDSRMKTFGRVMKSGILNQKMVLRIHATFCLLMLGKNSSYHNFDFSLDSDVGLIFDEFVFWEAGWLSSATRSSYSSAANRSQSEISSSVLFDANGSFCSWSKYFSKLKNVSKKTGVIFDLFRSHREILSPACGLIMSRICKTRAETVITLNSLRIYDLTWQRVSVNGNDSMPIASKRRDCSV